MSQITNIPCYICGAVLHSSSKKNLYKVFVVSPLTGEELHCYFYSISVRGAKKKFTLQWGKSYKHTRVQKVNTKYD